MSIENEIKNLTAAIEANTAAMSVLHGTEVLQVAEPVTADEVIAAVEDVPTSAAGAAVAKKEAEVKKETKKAAIQAAKSKTRTANIVIEEKVEAETDNSTPVNIEEVRDMCIKVNGTGQGAIIELLAKFDATTATNLDEKHYAAIVLEGNKIIAKAGA
ncbi:hypothetical protein KAR91_29435 [Candidatus Pacearchaeota archaeon]|nr:hypothetical protein [Candidatus Pacearchaeota archaeon]